MIKGRNKNSLVVKNHLIHRNPIIMIKDLSNSNNLRLKR